LLIIAIVFWKKKKNIPPDYYTLFMMGLVWFVIGFPLENHALSIMGIVFAVIGLANKDKWKKNRRRWSQLDPDEKKIKLIIMIILGVLVVAGFIVLVLKQKGILF
jgi:hypothetical protein